MRKLFVMIPVLLSLAGCAVQKAPVQKQEAVTPENATLLCTNNERAAQQHTLSMPGIDGHEMFFDGKKYTMFKQGMIDNYAVVMYQTQGSTELVALLTPGEGVWYMHWKDMQSERDEFGFCRAN